MCKFNHCWNELNSWSKRKWYGETYKKQSVWACCCCVCPLCLQACYHCKVLLHYLRACQRTGERIRQHRKTARGTRNAFAELIWAWDMSLSHCQVTLATAAQLIALIAWKKDPAHVTGCRYDNTVEPLLTKVKITFFWAVINIVFNSSNTSMLCSGIFMVMYFTECCMHIPML